MVQIEAKATNMISLNQYDKTQLINTKRFIDQASKYIALKGLMTKEGAKDWHKLKVSQLKQSKQWRKVFSK